MGEPVFVAGLSYRDPKAALAWLERAFGFETTMAIDGPDGDPTMCHYEMGYQGRGRIMLGGEWSDSARSPASVGGVNTQSMHVDIAGETPATAADLDAHCAQARAAGAVIAMEPQDQFYGDRTYRALDLEGHVWTFSARTRQVTRAEAEAASGLRIETATWK